MKRSLILPALAFFAALAPAASGQTIFSNGAGGGGPIPNATGTQSMAVGTLIAAVVTPMREANTARAELTAASLAEKKDEAAIRAKAAALGQAELKLALQRADEFAKLQAGPEKLTAEQVHGLVTLTLNITGRTILMQTRGPDGEIINR